MAILAKCLAKRVVFQRLMLSWFDEPCFWKVDESVFASFPVELFMRDCMRWCFSVLLG